MPDGWIIVVVLAGLVVAGLLWGAGRWLASSWEVLDDDQLSERLSGQGASRTPVVWLLVRGWFSRVPRRLTYRRDERGRFRRTRR